MSNKILIAGIAVVAVGGIAIGLIVWNNNKKEEKVSASEMKVSTSWGTPRAASGATDSLGLTVYPEMYETGRLDKQDACAWAGCIGELDANGRCTGCPQM